MKNKTMKTKKIKISLLDEYRGSTEVKTQYKKTEVKKTTEKIIKYFLENETVLSQSVLKNFEFEKLSFDVNFVDNDEIHQINKEYRSKDTPTDVITFALFADSEPRFVLDGEISLGDIIVSMDTIYSQAKENGNTFLYELYYIISHGILHLLGFDHLDTQGYKFMVEWQKKSLEELDV